MWPVYPKTSLYHRVQEATRGFPPVSQEGNGATRYGQSALNANDDGEVRVNRNDVEDFAIPYDNEGGRAVEGVNLKTSHLGTFSLRIKAKFFACVFSPTAKHSSYFLKSTFTMNVSVLFIDAKIMHKPDH